MLTDPTVWLVLAGVALVLSIVAIAQSRATSVLAWACGVGFFALVLALWPGGTA